jgi:hypothetical protein
MFLYQKDSTKSLYTVKTKLGYTFIYVFDTNVLINYTVYIHMGEIWGGGVGRWVH